MSGTNSPRRGGKQPATTAFRAVSD
jgi:hypothetical protein